MSAVSIPDWEAAGGERRDQYDLTAAAEFLPCQSCMDFRTELEQANTRLAKAHALLRLLRRSEVKPQKQEGLEDDPLTLALIAHVVLIATLKARIDLYLQATGTRL
jgi:hypothetical protein